MLSDKDVDLLKQAHKQTREKRLADRIKSVLMLHFGFTYEQIKQALLLDEVTVRRYVKQFKEKGINGLLEYHYTGGKTKLTASQELALKHHLANSSHIYQSAKEVASYVRKTYDIHFSVIGITKLLHRLGFTYKKPKLVGAKADAKLQQQFLDNYLTLKQELGEQDQIYFLDATHPQHNTRATYGWILKGRDRLIKSNTGRERVNINGALNAKTHAVEVREDKRINAQSTIALLNQLKAKHPAGKIYLIWDNARYYYCREVKTYLRKNKRLIPKFLPSYSPNLNLIERLWKLFHQKVINNTYYETFREFKEACMGFFQNIRRYQKEMKTLLTDSFQLVPT